MSAAVTPKYLEDRSEAFAKRAREIREATDVARRPKFADIRPGMQMVARAYHATPSTITMYNIFTTVQSMSIYGLTLAILPKSEAVIEADRFGHRSLVVKPQWSGAPMAQTLSFTIGPNGELRDNIDGIPQMLYTLQVFDPEETYRNYV